MDRSGNAICDSFIHACDAYSNRAGALSYSAEAVFSKKGGGVEGAAAYYSYSTFTVCLIYNLSVGGAKSVLEARISFTSSNEVDFSLYDLLYMLDENDFNCYIFPYIENAERMSACAQTLFAALDKYRAQISAIGEDNKIINRAISKKKKEMRRYFRTDIFFDGQDPSDPLFIWQKNCYRDWYISRFCAKWYRDYILGNYISAAKAFSKYESKGDYEIRLLRYIKALGSGAKNSPVSDESNTFILWKKSFSGVKYPAYFIALSAFILPLFAGYELFFCAGYYAIYRTAFFCTSLFSAQMFIVPFICALVTDIFLSDITYGRFISAKKKEVYINTFGALRTEEDARASGFTLNFVAVISLVAVLICAKWGIAVYKDGIADNRSLLSGGGESYSDAVSAEKSDNGYSISFADGEVYKIPCEAAEKYILPRLPVSVDG